MSQHTPTPWVRSTYTATPTFHQITEHTAICKEDGALIAVNGRMDDQQSIVDAEFICRAVNSHKALLKAAKHFADCQFQDADEMTCPECELAEEAIAQAELKP